MDVIQMTPDDKKAIQQIMETHSPDAKFDMDKKSFLSKARDILSTATPNLSQDPKTYSKLLEPLLEMPEEVAFTINKIGCELVCNCSGEGHMMAITLAVSSAIVKYAWEDKVVIVLIAFVILYGEHCLLLQLHATNPLAKYVFQLKRLLDISDRETHITGLLKVVIEVADSIIKLQNLGSYYISRDKSPFSDALTQVPTIVYYAIEAIVACSTQSISLMNTHQDMVLITENLKKLIELTQTMNKLHGLLTNKLELCFKVIEEEKNNTGYQSISRAIQTHNIVEICTGLIHSKDANPLFNGVDKKRVSLTVLKEKMVILFFSYYDISDEEIKEIVQQVGKAEGQHCEIVWFPIVHDRQVTSNEIKDVMLQKASMMPWYSLHNSLTLNTYAITYIKKDWHFAKKPVLVVFDVQGKIVNYNAYHMIMLWGSTAYPFDTKREENLWKETGWSLEFFIKRVVSGKQWVTGEKLIFLYGGDDLEWIRKFTSLTKEVVKEDGFTLELIYVGKKHRENISKENLSKCWDDLETMRFLARLDNVFFSKMQQKNSIEEDTTLKDVMTLLSANSSGHGWVIIGHKSTEMVVLNEKAIMDFITLLKTKKVSITIPTLFTTLKEVTSKNATVMDPDFKHCNSISLPFPFGKNMENIKCVECGLFMEKFVTFKCCNE